MSVDHFLVSSSHKKAVMVGSINIAGVSTYMNDPEPEAFIRWAIENFVTDVRMVNEDELFVLQGDDEFESWVP